MLLQADFSAFVSSGPCRCIRISRQRFSAAVDHSSLERHSHHGPTNKSGNKNANDSGASKVISAVAAPTTPTKQPPVTEATNAAEQGDDSNNTLSRNERLIAALRVVGTPAAITKKQQSNIGSTTTVSRIDSRMPSDVDGGSGNEDAVADIATDTKPLASEPSAPSTTPSEAVGSEESVDSVHQHPTTPGGTPDEK